MSRADQPLLYDPDPTAVGRRHVPAPTGSSSEVWSPTADDFLNGFVDGWPAHPITFCKVGRLVVVQGYVLTDSYDTSLGGHAALNYPSAFADIGQGVAQGQIDDANKMTAFAYVQDGSLVVAPMNGVDFVSGSPLSLQLSLTYIAAA